MERPEMKGQWPTTPDQGMIRDHKGWRANVLLNILIAEVLWYTCWREYAREKRRPRQWEILMAIPKKRLAWSTVDLVPIMQRL